MVILPLLGRLQLRTSGKSVVIRSSSSSSEQLSLNGRSDRIRTCDVLLPKQVLYQAELRSEDRADTIPTTPAGRNDYFAKRHRVFAICDMRQTSL